MLSLLRSTRTDLMDFDTETTLFNHLPFSLTEELTMDLYAEISQDHRVLPNPKEWRDKAMSIIHGEHWDLVERKWKMSVDADPFYLPVDRRFNVRHPLDPYHLMLDQEPVFAGKYLSVLRAIFDGRVPDADSVYYAACGVYTMAARYTLSDRASAEDRYFAGRTFATLMYVLSEAPYTTFERPGSLTEVRARDRALQTASRLLHVSGLSGSELTAIYDITHTEWHHRHNVELWEPLYGADLMSAVVSRHPLADVADPVEVYARGAALGMLPEHVVRELERQLRTFDRRKGPHQWRVPSSRMCLLHVNNTDGRYAPLTFDVLTGLPGLVQTGGDAPTSRFAEEFELTKEDLDNFCMTRQKSKRHLKKCIAFYHKYANSLHHLRQGHYERKASEYALVREDLAYLRSKYGDARAENTWATHMNADARFLSQLVERHQIKDLFAELCDEFDANGEAQILDFSIGPNAVEKMVSALRNVQPSLNVTLNPPNTSMSLTKFALMTLSTLTSFARSPRGVLDVVLAVTNWVFALNLEQGILNTLLAAVGEIADRYKAAFAIPSGEVQSGVPTDTLLKIVPLIGSLVTVIVGFVCVKKMPKDKEWMDSFNAFSRMAGNIRSFEALVDVGNRMAAYVVRIVRVKFMGEPDDTDFADLQKFVDAVATFRTADVEGRLRSSDATRKELHHLIAEGVRLTKMCDDFKVPIAHRTGLAAANVFLESLRNKVAAFGTVDGEPRMAPPLFHIVGDTSVGKSTCLDHFLAHILVATGSTDPMDIKKAVYYKSPTEDGRWDGYTKEHRVTVFDDAFLIRDGEANPSFDALAILKCINTAPFMLPMAHLVDKGSTFFKCDAVFMTTNRASYPLPSLSNSEAVWRRVCRRFRQKPRADFRRATQINGMSVQILDEEKVRQFVGADPSRFTSVVEFDELDPYSREERVLDGRSGLSFEEVAETMVRDVRRKWESFKVQTTALNDYFRNLVAKHTGTPIEEVPSLDEPTHPIEKAPFTQEEWKAATEILRPEELNITEDDVRSSSNFVGSLLSLAMGMPSTAPDREMKDLSGPVQMFRPWPSVWRAFNDERDIRAYALTPSKGESRHHVHLPTTLAYWAVLSENLPGLGARYTESLEVPEYVWPTCAGVENLPPCVFVRDKAIQFPLIHALHETQHLRGRARDRAFFEICGLTPEDFGPCVKNCKEPCPRYSAFVEAYIREYTAKGEGSALGTWKRFQCWEEAQTRVDGVVMTAVKNIASIACVALIGGLLGDAVHSLWTRQPQGIFERVWYHVLRFFGYGGETEGADPYQKKGKNYRARIEAGTRLVQTRRQYERDEQRKHEEGTVQLVLDTNGREMVPLASKNMYAVEYFDGDWKHALTGVVIKGRILMVNNHLRLKREFTRWRLRNAIRTYEVDLWKCKIATYPKEHDRYLADVMLVELPLQVHQHPDITSKFATRDDLATHTEISHVCLMTMTPEVNALKLYYSSDCVAVDGHFRMTNKGAGVGMIRRYWKYGIQTVGGDCGGLVIAHDKSMARKLVGIHAAGVNQATYQGVAQPVTQEMLNELVEMLGARADSLMSVDISEFGGEEDGLEWDIEIDTQKRMGVFTPEAIAEGPIHLRVLPDQHYVAQPSRIHPSDLMGVFGEPMTKPAKLKPFKGEDGQFLDPLAIAHQKVEVVAPKIDEDRARRCARAVAQKINVLALPQHRRVLTREEAIAGVEGDEFISGIPRQSAAGFGWKKGYGKTLWLGRDEYVTDHPEVVAKVDKILEKCRSGKRPNVVWVDVLKDERRPKKKVDQGKTRLFSVGQMEYTIAFRMYFLGFGAHLMRRRIDAESCVGINPFGRDWDRVAEVLQKISDLIVAGDFANYDGTLHPFLMWLVLDIIEDFYQGCPEDRLVRAALWSEIVNSIHLHRNKLEMWTQSNPSGNPLTALLNSVYHSIAVRYVFLACAIKAKKIFGLADFERLVAHVNYGDDDLYAIAHEIIDWFNQLTMTEAFTDLGMTYTDEAKTGELVRHRSLGEVRFLKRAFAFDEVTRRFLAPLDVATITEMPMWVRGHQHRTRNTIDTLLDSYREACLHSREEFDRLVPAFERARQMMSRHETIVFEDYLAQRALEFERHCLDNQY